MIVVPDSPLDRALFSAMPTVLAPKRDPLPELGVGHSRLVLAHDGLYIEARSNVLHARGRIAAAEKLPYGEAPAFVERLIPSDCQPLLGDAVEHAAAACPNEWAAVIIGDGPTLRLYQPPVLDCTSARIRYDATAIDPLNIMWDIHSHGQDNSYFSTQDNLDDLQCPAPLFIASVIGRADTGRATWVSRLVIAGRAFRLDDLRACVHLASSSARVMMYA